MSRLIHQIRLKNLLSFGQPGIDLELKDLNVLIGPNSAGKSNLIEVMGLLKGLPRDLTAPLREGGGAMEWLWKGAPQAKTAEIEATLGYTAGKTPLFYRLSLAEVNGRLEIADENLVYERQHGPHPVPALILYAYNKGDPYTRIHMGTTGRVRKSAGQAKRGMSGQNRRVKRSPARIDHVLGHQQKDMRTDQSVLSYKRDPDFYPELTYVGEKFASIQLYREWMLGPFSPVRRPQRVDLPDDFLLEDVSNLGLIVNDLQLRLDTKALILEKLKRFYENVTDLGIKVQGGTIQIFLHEKDLRTPVPTARLSDGTLRFLSLLAILCHPTPPPLVCIEEPELGLHPDIMPTLAELLQEASQKCQLIVTTHSAELVSALSSAPEDVVVCERAAEGTTFRRLEAAKLKDWLDKYALGDLWKMGELGGNRW